MLKLFNFKGKKGGEKIMSLWWIFEIVVIAVGITAMVYLLYDANTDVRGLDAELLYEKVSTCLIDNNGYLNEVFLSENNNELIFSECGIKKEIFSPSFISGSEGGSDFYLKITFSNYNKPLIIGKNSFEGDCEIVLKSEVESTKGYPICIPKKQSYLYKEGDEIKVGSMEILIASNQKGVRSIR